MKKTYTDINLDFALNPFTGDLIIASDSEAVKKSLRNIIFMNYYEAPFNPTKGSNIQGSLFEHFSTLGNEFMKKKIIELVEKNEPRVEIMSIDILQREDFNQLEVSIVYRILEVNRIETLSVYVGRTR